MDRCEILLKMLWTKSISMRQYKQMSRERGFAEILLLFLFVFIYVLLIFYINSPSFLQNP